MRHRKIKSRNVHRLCAFNGDAKIFGINFKGKITPVEAKRFKGRILHRWRCRMRNRRAEHGAQARSGVYPGLAGL